MKRTARRTIVSLAGLLVVLLVLELGLRVVGCVHRRQLAARRAPVSAADGSCRILCAGDSYTVGMGAPVGQDYPRQLQRLLDARGEPACQVVNSAVAGQNTAQILRQLRNDLPVLRPRVVVLLCGGANVWNHWGYDAGCGSWTRRVLYDIRLVKLVTLLARGVKDKAGVGDARRLDDVLESEVYESARQACRDKPGDARAHFELGLILLDARRAEEAKAAFLRGIELDPAMAHNYEGLANAFYVVGEFEEALAALKRGVRVDPGYLAFYRELGGMSSALGRFDDAVAYYKEGLKRDPMCLDFHQHLGSMMRFVDPEKASFEDLLREHPYDTGRAFYNLRRQLYHPNTLLSDKPEGLDRNDSLMAAWLERDLKAIQALCEREGALLILHDYPLRGRVVENSWMDMADKANQTLHKVAAELGTPIVFHAQTFIGVPGRDRLFEPRGMTEHCSAEGYALMARGVFEKLMEPELQAWLRNGSPSDSENSLR